MNDYQFRRFEIKLLIASVVIGGLSAIISSALGLYGVYLGSEAIRQTERLESVKIRPLLENTYQLNTVERWGIYTKNIGFGPAKIKTVTIGYKTEDGKSVWLRYGDGHSTEGLNLFEFLGVPGINSDALALPKNEQETKLAIINWPWIGANYGPGETLNFLDVPSDDSMSAEWRERYAEPLKRVLKSLCLGMEYESMDGVKISGLDDGQHCERLDLSESNRVN